MAEPSTPARGSAPGSRTPGARAFVVNPDNQEKLPGMIYGFGNRPPSEPGVDWVYCKPIRIHTKWPNLRCQFGCISYFFQLPNLMWVAATLKSIVQKDGTCGLSNPNSPSSVGVVVWMHEFVKDKASVSYDPTIYQDKGKFGKVIAELDENMVAIQVEDSVFNTEEFQNKGFWAKMCISY